MDIFFCDECGSRVTDLDLRAGRGMRRRHDTICPGCVDLGKAQDWLARHPEAAPAAAAAQANGNGHAPAAPAVAVAERPDPIALGRDRAVTQPDDDFLIDEPAPLKPVPAAAPIPPPAFETDRLESPRAKAEPPAPAPPSTPFDGLASAGGGFGALVGAGAPAKPSLVDDPEEGTAEALPQSQPETPFDFVAPADADNPGKTETAEVEAPVKPDKAETVKVSGGSGRQAVSARRGTTSRATPPPRSSTSRQSKAIKAPSSRQTSGAGGKAGNPKVMWLSLASLGLMCIIFFVFVLPSAGKGGDKKPQVIVDEPLKVLQVEVEKAKLAAHAALTTNDLATARYGLQCIRSMQDAFQAFERKAGAAWNEDAHGEQLRRIGYYDVQGMLKGVNDRIMVLENRNK